MDYNNDILLVGLLEIRKNIIIIMNTDGLTLVYIAVMVFAIGAYILVYTGKIEKKRTSR